MTWDENVRTELLATFRAELDERCQALTRVFLELEKGSETVDSRQLLDDAFRSAHSVKGAARTVGFGKVEQLAHHLEDVLGAIRRGERQLTPELFDVLYASIDALATALDATSSGGQSIEVLLPQLAHLPEQRNHTGEPDLPRSTASSLAVTVAADAERLHGVPGSGETIRLPSERLDKLLEQLGELVIPCLALGAAPGQLATLRDDVRAWQREWRNVRPLFRELIRGNDDRRLAPALKFLERNETSLDRLVARLTALHGELDAQTAHLGTLADGLHDEAKLLRVAPFGQLTEGMERMVRDLARSLDKDARLVLIGSDVEMDRRVLDEIKVPLLHLLRNAMDHGIETREIRIKRGKPIIGRVVVTARPNDGMIVVEVEDDGAGLDFTAIQRAAVNRNLKNEQDLPGLSESETLRLIFQPGLSTRQDVSTISGRGMGLDIVARQVERLGGRIDVESRFGHYTRFAITLPRMLAATRGILVETRGHVYALPTPSVERLLRIEKLSYSIGYPTFTVDDLVLPVAALGDVLGIRSDDDVASDPPGTLAVVVANDQRVALTVDGVLSEQAMIVKPLGYPLRRVRHYSGATVLGSGQIVPILNPADIVRTIHQGSVRPRRSAPKPKPRPRVLVADDASTTRTLERSILEAAGYDVEVVGDGAQALELLQRQPFDVLVSDITMPNLDGVTLTALLRQDSKFETLPIILVTSLDSDVDRERGLQAGADAYIVKNRFDQEQLVQTIREFLAE